MKLYIVVGFPFNYIEELIRHKREEEEHLQKTKDPNYIREPNVKLEDRSNEDLVKMIKRFAVGQLRNMGYFSSLEAAKDSIRNHPCHSSLSECGYYSYLCIEEIEMDYLDVYAEEYPLWYKLPIEGDYEECAMPDWAEGIFNWS